MGQLVTEIPFVHHGRQGVIEVRYGPNTSVEGSGFDLLEGVGFDVAVCLGYPTLEARIARYAGSGYRTCMAWIQIVTDRYYTEPDGAVSLEVSDVDTLPALADCGVPFFAHGFPATLYDAPCDNLGDYARLEWVAHTFMVTYPTRMDDHTISFLSGFRWGYEEWDEGGRRCVSLRPLEVLGRTEWVRHLGLLRQSFPRWRYA